VTLEKLADELGVSEFVTLTELQAIFKVATAMVFPSRFEGFGLPILEALQACLPYCLQMAAPYTTLLERGSLFRPDGTIESHEGYSGLARTAPRSHQK
jgi:glycosyltransferase involved in cell wall biosynthesis